MAYVGYCQRQQATEERLSRVVAAREIGSAAGRTGAAAYAKQKRIQTYQVRCAMQAAARHAADSEAAQIGARIKRASEQHMGEGHRHAALYSEALVLEAEKEAAAWEAERELIAQRAILAKQWKDVEREDVVENAQQITSRGLGEVERPREMTQRQRDGRSKAREMEATRSRLVVQEHHNSPPVKWMGRIHSPPPAAAAPHVLSTVYLHPDATTTTDGGVPQLTAVAPPWAAGGEAAATTTTFLRDLTRDKMAIHPDKEMVVREPGVSGWQRRAAQRAKRYIQQQRAQKSRVADEDRMMKEANRSESIAILSAAQAARRQDDAEKQFLAYLMKPRVPHSPAQVGQQLTVVQLLHSAVVTSTLNPECGTVPFSPFDTELLPLSQAIPPAVVEPPPASVDESPIFVETQLVSSDMPTVGLPAASADGVQATEDVIEVLVEQVDTQAADEEERPLSPSKGEVVVEVEVEVLEEHVDVLDAAAEANTEEALGGDSGHADEEPVGGLKPAHVMEASLSSLTSSSSESTLTSTTATETPLTSLSVDSHTVTSTSTSGVSGGHHTMSPEQLRASLLQLRARIEKLRGT